MFIIPSGVAAFIAAMLRLWGVISMKLRAHFLLALALFSVSLTLVLRAISSPAAADIENPTCELIAPGVYRLDYQAASGAGPVQVLAS
jgi:hypothetical protein